jgi:hypothetical protein
MPTLVSLISEQTLPNVLFIKQMGPVDRYVFLSTARMEEEGRSDWVIQACGLPTSRCDVVLVDPQDALLTMQELEELRLEDVDTYRVNLTGGTKMMALAAYAFFTRMEAKVEIYYLPINSPKTIRIYPDQEEQTLNAKVNLMEYLSAYGVQVLEQGYFSNTWVPRAERIFRHVTGLEVSSDLKGIFPEANQQFSDPLDKAFYSGGWLEIWLHERVKQVFSLDRNEIDINLKLNKSGNPKDLFNEYDLMYLRNNHLYVGECKFYPAGIKNKSKINVDLYKLGNLRSQMGLYARPFVVIGSLEPIQRSLKEKLSEHCRELKIKEPIYLEELKDPETLPAYLKSF